MTYPIDDAILATLSDDLRLTTKAISERIGESYSVTRERLRLLATSGFVRKVSDTEWCRTVVLVESGDVNGAT